MNNSSPVSYPLASDTWASEEMEAINRVIASRQFTMGSEVSEFEKEFANYLGSKFCVMVNSGSSANLLMLAALSLIPKFQLPKDSEVIVPAVSWATTFYPVHQLGYKLRFVDIDPLTLNLNVDRVLDSINSSTSAIFAVNLLGLPSPLDQLQEICEQNNLILIEDNCESLGASLQSKLTGTWGVMGSFSSYFSHHMSTMEGGMICTDDEEIYHYLVSIRSHGWTRGLPAKNFVKNKSDNPWDHLFDFALPGYNLRPIEFEAAVGREQLKKLPDFLEAREENQKYFYSIFSQIESLVLQVGPGKTSSFGFSMYLGNPEISALNGQIIRTKIVSALHKIGVESRPIVTGNFTKNSVMKYLNHAPLAEYPVADRVHNTGFFLGNHHYSIKDQIDQAFEVIEKVLVQEGIQ